MSANRKDYRWCRACRTWVLAFPLGVDGMCGKCLVELSEHEKNQAERKAAAAYLERDYQEAAMV